MSRRNRPTKPDLFTSLPAEIRRQIYTYYFADSYIRYYRRTHFDRGKLIKRHYCHGPPEIALLCSNHLIYNEAMPVLQCSNTLLIDRTEGFAALRNIAAHLSDEAATLNLTPFPRLLAELTRGIRHLIISKVDCSTPYSSNSLFSSTKRLSHLRTVTLFGVYPTLLDFMHNGGAVPVGNIYARCTFIPLGLLPQWCWVPPLMGIRHSGERWLEVDLGVAAHKLHTLLGRDAAEMRVEVRAWCQGYLHSGEMTLLHVSADLDDPWKGFHWEVLGWGNVEGWRKGRWLPRPWHPVWTGSRWARFERETTARMRRVVERQERTRDLGSTSGWGWRWPADEGDWPLQDDPHGTSHLGGTEPVQPVEAATGVGEPSLHPVTAAPDSRSEDEDDAAVIRTRGQLVLQEHKQSRRVAPSAEPAEELMTPFVDTDASNWATMTDSGDWQSVCSGEVASKQWDAALELPLPTDPVVGGALTSA